MPSCGIGVAAGHYVKAAVNGRFAVFSHGRHDAAKKVQPGDRVAYNAPREGMNVGGERRAFVAKGQVLAGLPGWFRRMRWLDAERTDIYRLFNTLLFVINRQHWGIYFRKSLFKIDSGDFELIADAMGVGSKFGNADQS